VQPSHALYTLIQRLTAWDWELVMPDNEAVILLVEDDRVDIMTVQRALKKIDVSNPLHVAR
jgi:hypothetical protein